MRAFSLIEVVIALGIFGMLLLMLVAIGRTTPLTRISHDQDIALRIAQNELESLRGGGYGSLPMTGSFSDPLLSSLPFGGAALTVSTFGTTTKQVTVTVSWKDASASSTQSVSLSTLITQTGGLP